MKALAILWLLTAVPTSDCIKKDKTESFTTYYIKTSTGAAGLIEKKTRTKKTPIKFVKIDTTWRKKGKLVLPKIADNDPKLQGWPKSCFSIRATALSGKTYKIK